MILKQILLISLILLVAGALEWRNLKHASPGNRWFFIATLLVSGGLWIYLYSDLHVKRPVRWMMEVLEPFDPIQ